ncbi:hypothetical protein BD324DRAFT_577959 [Kockovaella imperatae]|uniref:PRELI/MSF1 domain-containing protein n=1 Tax=Kockovaella imperatae TaxID=4999 RepID=A0A1Y1UJN8_9TREE|nr:hypothetical protein BD324DRAFT_577959 [Kockovaella imperatae]ORX38271.1 hypothetical protein BD324DRAFT_577959 [Kockovaella imperatae]
MTRLVSFHSPDPPAQAIQAFFVRYPNPFARHVLSVDVLDRWIDLETGRLHTKRLILKRGILPKWAARWLPVSSSSGGRGLDAWVMEDSVVDPPGWGEWWSPPKDKAGQLVKGKEREDWDVYRWLPRLKLVQGNLNHRKFMHVLEGGELRGQSDGHTSHITTVEIRSDFGGSWSKLIRDRIEAQGAGRFLKNTERARQGMILILDAMRNRQPLPADTMEFYPPPAPSFGDHWPSPTDQNRKDSATSPSEESQGSYWNRWRRKEEHDHDHDDQDDDD